MLLKPGISVASGVFGSVSAGGVAAEQPLQGTFSVETIEQGIPANRYGFYFTAGLSGEAASLSFRPYRAGGASTGTFTAELRNYTAGGTVGSLIATSTSLNPATFSGVAASATTQQMLFSGGAIVSGNAYCIIWNISGLSGNLNVDSWGNVNDSNATIGNLASTDSGSTWSEVGNREIGFSFVVS